MTIEEIVTTGSGLGAPEFFRRDPQKQIADKGDFGINLQLDFCYLPSNVYELVKAVNLRTMLEFASHVMAFPTYYVRSLDWTMEDLKRAKIIFYAATGIEELISEPKPPKRVYGTKNPLDVIRKEDIDKSKPSDFI